MAGRNDTNLNTGRGNRGACRTCPPAVSARTRHGWSRAHGGASGEEAPYGDTKEEDGGEHVRASIVAQPANWPVRPAPGVGAVLAARVASGGWAGEPVQEEGQCEQPAGVQRRTGVGRCAPTYSGGNDTTPTRHGPLVAEAARRGRAATSTRGHRVARPGASGVHRGRASQSRGRSGAGAWDGDGRHRARVAGPRPGQAAPPSGRWRPDLQWGSHSRGGPRVLSARAGCAADHLGHGRSQPSSMARVAVLIKVPNASMRWR